MTMDTLLLHAPKVLATLMGACFVYVLLKYKRKHDAQSWIRYIYATSAKAEKNERFRQDELADANAELAGLPVPNPIVPISRKRQIRYAAFPKMLFMSGLTAAVFLYMAILDAAPEDMQWLRYAGWAFLAFTGVLYWLTERERPYFRRVQQLNRKYLLQKAGRDPERFATLREVLEYYPNLSELWLELGDQYAVDKRYDEAVEAMATARKLSPEKLDFAIVEASFQLRRGDADALSKVLDGAEGLKRAPSDPRIAIYRAAVALLRNEKKTALRYGRDAMALDSDFTEQLVKKDAGLQGLAALWEELFQKKEAEIFEAVAARQEARKAEQKDEAREEEKQNG